MRVSLYFYYVVILCYSEVNITYVTHLKSSCVKEPMVLPS